MLMTERTLRHSFGASLEAGVKMPRKGHTLYISSPYAPSGMGIWWTDRKSPEGKRLFNVGNVRPNGEQPPLFQM